MRYLRYLNLDFRQGTLIISVIKFYHLVETRTVQNIVVVCKASGVYLYRSPQSR